MVDVWNYLGPELLMSLGSSYSQAVALQYDQLDPRRMLDIRLNTDHHITYPRSVVRLPDPHEPLRRLTMVQPPPTRTPTKPLTSFGIKDILSAGSSRKSSLSAKRNHPFLRDRTDRNSHACKRDKKSVFAVSKPYDTVNSNHFPTKCRRGDVDVVAHGNMDVVEREGECKIVRPWHNSPTSSPSTVKSYRCSSSELEIEDDQEIDVEGDTDQVSDSTSGRGYPGSMPGEDVSPLDALMKMSTAAFKELDSYDGSGKKDGGSDNGKSQVPKKKRKTRTAFTNQQIYELEKRFLYQKYLTPADRDDISQKLGLTCAQVITWFQNRRAKFKRDIEELKNDVVATSTTDPEETCSKSNSPSDENLKTNYANSGDNNVQMTSSDASSETAESSADNDNACSSSDDQCTVSRLDLVTSRGDNDSSIVVNSDADDSSQFEDEGEENVQ